VISISIFYSPNILMINFIKDIYIYTHIKLKSYCTAIAERPYRLQWLYNRALFHKETLERCSLLKLLLKSLLKLCQTFSFSGSVSWKSTPTYIGRMQGSGGISHRRWENRFLRWNSANMSTDFSYAEYRREIENTNDVTELNGESSRDTASDVEEKQRQ